MYKCLLEFCKTSGSNVGSVLKVSIFITGLVSNETPKTQVGNRNAVTQAQCLTQKEVKFGVNNETSETQNLNNCIVRRLLKHCV